jgi:GMP synthase (glutamine-hydrolysing)
MRFLVLQHKPFEGLGRYGQFARDAGIKLETVELWRPGYKLPNPEEYPKFDAAFVMGGPQGANDPREDYPSRDDEVRFLQQFDKSAFCVCLGSQLHAYSRGARVYRGDRKECGFYVVRLTPQGKHSPIFRGFDDQFDVFHWHGDVFNVPDGATPLVVSKYDGSVQAYSMDGKIATLFHLELSPQNIGELFDGEGQREWFGSKKGFNEYHGNTEEQVKRRAEELDAEMESNARKAFDNFRLVAESQSLV